jgi:hypothetical protein
MTVTRLGKGIAGCRLPTKPAFSQLSDGWEAGGISVADQLPGRARKCINIEEQEILGPIQPDFRL